MAKQFDIIVYGATSFVGQITVRYLQQHLQGSDVKWALAGRNANKLEQVKSETGANDVPVIIADSSDEASLKAMCEQGSVIISTVGPYALYGEPLVKACVENGNGYCDLTGEVQWVDRMIEKYEAQAKQTGARIVHCCGFDSIPSDMGAFFLQEQAKEVFGHTVPDTKMAVHKIRGGASGGTIASAINITKEAVKDPALRKKLLNPYLICPQPNQYTEKNWDKNFAYFDNDFNAWTAPFVMAAVNTRVVFRSNALMDYAYGKGFKYSEVMLTGNKAKSKRTAKGMSFGIKAFLVLAALPPTRWALEKFILPKPGEGPTPTEQEKGFFDIRHIAKDTSGKSLEIKVTGDRDPGYGSTAKMLSQAALCLAKDIDESVEGGFWTTSSLFGHKLVKRLEDHAGLTFETVQKS